MEIRELNVADLVPRADARRVSDSAVARLAESLDDIGQLQPIRARPRGAFFEVTFGWHRVLAHRQAGRETIACQVVEEDDLQAEKAMLDENLVRSELGKGDLEYFLARRKAIYLQEHPETAKGRSQAAKLNGRVSDNKSPTFSRAMGEQLGLHHDTVQRMVSRGERLNPEALELVRDTPLMDDSNFLDRLASMAVSEQPAFAKQALETTPPKRTKGVATIETTWAGLSEARRREFVSRHRNELLDLLGHVT